MYKAKSESVCIHWIVHQHFLWTGQEGIWCTNIMAILSVTYHCTKVVQFPNCQ